MEPKLHHSRKQSVIIIIKVIKVVKILLKKVSKNITAINYFHFYNLVVSDEYVHWH